MAGAPTFGGAPQPGQDQYGDGWLFFAGTMLFITGSMNIVYGLGALRDSEVFVRDAALVIGDLDTSGWLLLGFGIALIGAALSIWVRTEWGRWLGIVAAAGNGVVQLLALPAAPQLAISLLALDVLIVYGLLVYGGRRAEAR
jgi:hypothetical protein